MPKKRNKSFKKSNCTPFKRRNNAKKKRNNAFQNAFVRLSKGIIMRKKRNNAFQKA